MNEDEIQLLLKSAMCATSLVAGADDEVLPSELKAFFETFMANYDIKFPDQSIEEIIENIIDFVAQDRDTPGGIEETLQSVGEARVLGVDERAFILDLAHAIALADGDLRPEELEMCKRIAQALDLPYTPLSDNQVLSEADLKNTIAKIVVNVSSSVEGGPEAEPLVAAARLGDLGRVRTLLSNGDDPNGVNEDLNWPLQVAAEEGHVDIIRILLEWGADPDKTISLHGGSALLSAAEEGRTEAVQALLTGGANPNALNDRIASFPLAAAAGMGKLETVKALLAGGANPNLVHTSKGSLTALQVAAASGRLEIIATLLAAGADVDLGLDKGASALVAALQHRQEGAAAALLKAGATPVRIRQ